MATTNADVATNEEIKIQLNERVVQTGQDEFVVKIHRRMQPASPHIHVATFDGVALEKIANAENWLQQLAGGGPQYVLECYHVSERSKLLGGRLVFNMLGEPQPVNPDVVNQPNWDGPARMIAPRPIVRPAQTAASSPIYGIAYPPTSPAGGTQTLSPGSTPNVSGPPVGGFAPEMLALKAQLEHQLRDIEAERIERRAKEREAEAERRANDAIRLAQEESRKAREEAQRLREEVRTRPAENQNSGLKEMVLGLAPLFMQFFKDSAQARAEHMAAIQASNERMIAVIQAQSQKPAIDPEFKALLLERGQAPNAEAIASTADAMTRMASNAVRMATALADSRGGESTELLMLGEVRKGIEAVGRALSTSVTKPTGYSGYGNGTTGPAQPAPAPGPQAPPVGGAKPIKLDWNDPKIPLIIRLIDRVRWVEPQEALVKDFIMAYQQNEPSVIQALKTVPNDNPIALLERELGKAWLDDNQGYAVHLVDEFQRQATPLEEEDAEVVEDAP